MNDINQLKNQQRQKHPGFDSYLECMTRGLFAGLTTFAFGNVNKKARRKTFNNGIIITGFSGFYFLQKLTAKRLPYSDKYYILIAGVISAGAAYSVTKSKTYVCQTAWVEAEKPRPQQ